MRNSYSFLSTARRDKSEISYPMAGLWLSTGNHRKILGSLSENPEFFLCLHVFRMSLLWFCSIYSSLSNRHGHNTKVLMQTLFTELLRR